ncbi:MAG TPA: serine hydrolase domain-containing protein, partial [Cyclobacteriaceae bacterium]|nr:serine hydrolase domain-containing protein [Cyclobacteriaceae bacterium]
MRQLLFILILLLCSCNDNPSPQPVLPSLYFPPIVGNSWETLSPVSLGWNTSKIAELDAFMVSTNTRAILVLKDGKMVIEKYQGKQLINTTLDFTASSNWYWASAGKTLTAAVVGIAEAQGKINLDSKTSDYLGNGWTNLT